MHALHALMRGLPLSGIALMLGLATSAAARTPISVPSAELMAQLANSLCAGEETRDGERERFVLSGSQACPSAPRGTRRQRAILRALDEVNAVLVSSEAPLRKAREVEDRDERRQVYLTTLLADEANARAFWTALEAHGYVRSDAAPLAPPVRRELPWDAFAPYVVAYAWPDPVVTPRGPDGAPTGEAKFQLHVCAGINGIESIAEPDSLLARVAFVAAFDSAFTDLVASMFRDIVATLRKGPPRSDEELTTLARTHMAEAVRHRASVRETMCRAVLRREPVFGVHLTGC